jgi:spermidine synthase
MKLFLASFLALYFELIIIRYLSSEIRVFAYLKNLPLIASFFGLGLGMVLGKKETFYSKLFPFTALSLFLLIHFSHELGFIHLPFPRVDYFIWGRPASTSSPFILIFRYAGFISLISALIVLFCIPLGSRIGRYLVEIPPLKGYGVNLLGSIGGIGVFTLLSYLETPPWLWVGLGSVILFGFYWKSLMARIIFLLLPLILAFAPANTFWSPYYRISLNPGKILHGETAPSVVYLSVNHDYHQKILDLSNAFFERHPKAEPNYSALLTYNLPYNVHPGAKRVLVIGAGTGNDVAAALRHGAENVDAVEIDPVILEIGKAQHPEKPYSSPHVKTYLDDARVFLKKTKKRYDLIVFAFLDSHTLLANSSSLRLDNFVYTMESFQEARNLLVPDGTLVLAFAGGKTFVSARIYNMLKDVFRRAPVSYSTGYDKAGVVFVSGANISIPELASIPVINHVFEQIGSNIAPATDRWPFLYLRERSIPVSYYVVFILLILAWLFTRRTLKIEKLMTYSNLHFFMLGSAFLLLETKAVTELSLLFGSTWVVNTIAILSFLVMAIAANILIMYTTPSRKIIYTLLFASLFVSIIFPLKLLFHLHFILKIFTAGLMLALPVFFSGMLFSRAFRDTHNPGQSLGVNLIGALIGGIAENFVMIGGTLLLGGLAVLFYGISLFGVVKLK